jgi:hypothetical protein
MTDNESAKRAAIVAAARSWIGTPYHNCADIRCRGGLAEHLGVY